MFVEGKAGAGFGVYVHWPFCAAKCPYCDFNSHVRAQVDQRRWAAALVGELTWAAEQTQGHTVDTVFFGGGTPSMMVPETVSTVMQAITSLWPVSTDLEASLEANPTSVEAARFEDFRTAGVNRVSIGVQALDDKALLQLGRLHSVAEAEEAVQIARAIFPRMSFDLIYARQDQSVTAWEAELSRALDLAADHLSLYQLTIEAGTAFGARHAAGGLRGLPTDGEAVALYEVTQALCTARGLAGYEISNHATPGARCRHNLIYWQGGSYVGVGPGAHGRYGEPGFRVATQTSRNPEAWLSSVENQGHGTSESTSIPTSEQAEEYLMMALRLTDGADLAYYEALSGVPLPSGPLAVLSEAGFVEIAGSRIRVTSTGRLILNRILAELLC